jgi:hypothetical protein
MPEIGSVNLTRFALPPSADRLSHCPTVWRFNAKGEVQRPDGVNERLVFGEIQLPEIVHEIEQGLPQKRTRQMLMTVRRWRLRKCSTIDVLIAERFYERQDICQRRNRIERLPGDVIVVFTLFCWEPEKLRHEYRRM